jgi:phage terminase large subunit-like protein
LILAGRGWGKTATGAHWVTERIIRHGARYVAAIAPTASDARDVIAEGPAGLIASAPESFRPLYEPSKRRLTYPNGATVTLFSADEPDRLRGPQHDAVWADELAAWRKADDTWAMAMMGLRLGQDPRALVTTTPRPVRIVRELLEASTTRVTRGRTLDNAANLAPTFLDQIVSRYEGTRLGRQELDGELLLDTPGALWTLAMFDREGFRPVIVPDLARVVIAVDPAATSEEGSDETGIIAAGVGQDGRGYVLADESLRGSPLDWASTAITAYRTFKADRIVAESNNGGEMVAHTLRSVDARVPVTLVWASRGKLTRAEPIAALYEQGKVRHAGVFPELESQLTGWVPGMPSPDRLDALVWALTHLMLPETIPLQRKRSVVSAY